MALVYTIVTVRQSYESVNVGDGLNILCFADHACRNRTEDSLHDCKMFQVVVSLSTKYSNETT